MGDRRFVMLDTEGLEVHDLIQWDGEGFSKFTPLDAWTDLELPGDWVPLSELLGPEAPDIPAFGIRLDGLGGAYVRGALAISFADITFEAAGTGIYMATIPEEFRPATRSVINTNIIGLGAGGAMVNIGATLQFNNDGVVMLQPPSHHGPMTEDFEISTVLAGAMCVANLNGSYDTLS